MKIFLITLILFSASFSLNTAREKVGANYYHDRGIKGKGVICGVIDDVDITLNDFRDPVTHKTRVLAYKRLYIDSLGDKRWDIWNQTRIDSLLEAKYPYNQFNDFDSSSVFHNRSNNHGTIIGHIMAGNGTTLHMDGVTQTGLVGIAPESKFIIVSKPESSSIYFIDSVAAFYNMPWTTNISWTYGPSKEIKDVSGTNKNGKAVIVASGNNYYKNFTQVVFNSGDTVQRLVFSLDTLSNHEVVYKIGKRNVTYYFFMTSFNMLCGDSSDIALKFTTQYSEEITFSYNSDNMDGDSTFYLLGAEQNILFEQFKVEKFPTHQAYTFYAETQKTNEWYVDIIKPVSTEVETVDIAFSWRAHNYSPYGILPNNRTFNRAKYNMVDFAMVEEAITVGGNYLNIISFKSDTNFSVGEICEYSGVGPAFDGRIKPDITAPAHGLSTIFVVDTNTISGMVYHGTSFSAPLVAGCAALLLQEDSTRDVFDINTIFKERALANEFTGQLPNSVYGAGILNIKPDESQIDDYANFSNGQILSCYPNPFNPVIHIFVNGINSGVETIHESSLQPEITIYNINGKLVKTSTNATTIQWNAKSHPSGIYMVKAVINGKVLNQKITLIK